jgi:hypothetical protein
MFNRRLSAWLREADVKARRAMMMLAAAGLAISPVASNAASSLSIARAAPQLSGVSFLQDDEEHHGHRGVAVILGVVLVVLIGVAAIAGNGKAPNNPHSP